MKKILILTLLFLPTLTEINYSFVENKYITVPAVPDVDPAEYDLLACMVTMINWELINQKIPYAERVAQINDFLTSLDSPAARQLMADLLLMRA